MKVYPRLELDLAAADLRSAFAAGPGPAGVPALQRSVEARWPGPRRALAVLSVRTALDLYLQALHLPEGSEVLMSAVTIESMTEIVRRHGLRPVPLDLDLPTLAPPSGTLEAATTSRTRLLILTHLYGALVDLGPALVFCRQRGLLLVEDCAQAYAGDFYRGHPEADLSLFSFGPIKRQTALGGAVALVRDAALAGRMETIEQGYPDFGEGRFLRRVLKVAALKALSRPVIYGILLRILADPGAALRGFGKGDLFLEIRRRPAARCLRLLDRRLGQDGDPARADRARRLLARLGSEVERPGSAAARHAHWLVPILVRDPAALVTSLRAEGFDATRGATSLRVVEAPGAVLPHARRLLDEVVYLPVSALVPEADLERFAVLVHQFIAKDRKSDYP